MKREKIVISAAVSSIALAIFLPALALASGQTFELNVPIGTLNSITVGENSNFLGEYIAAWYGFLLGTVGILGAIMIMWGGFKYLTSRGDKGVIDKAKETIISAITGVVLAFGTYTLLSLLSPSLLEIKTPNLASLQGGENVNLEQDAYLTPTGEISKGETAPATPISSDNVNVSNNPSDWNSLGKLSGTPDLVNNATTLLNTLDSQNQLPEGLIVTSGYRSGTGQSWHGSGMAFDVAWPNMTVAEAEELVANVQAINPNFSSIIEFNGAYGSTGNNVHFDLRPTPIHLPLK